MHIGFPAPLPTVDVSPSVSVLLRLLVVSLTSKHLCVRREPFGSGWPPFPFLIAHADEVVGKPLDRVGGVSGLDALWVVGD